MNSYICCMCKKTFEGEPAMRNNAGRFCPECNMRLRARIAEGCRNRVRTSPEGCIWCGELIKDNRNHGDDYESVNICTACENHRSWLLKCIRVSDHPAKYVARVEAREAGKRKERKIRAADKQVPEPPKPVITESEERLARVEKMLTVLMEQLGA